MPFATIDNNATW